MKKSVEEKRLDEYGTVLFMIQIFCRGKHNNKLAMKNPENLCASCRNLSLYVKERVSKCPFMETKTFCSACRVHCYRTGERAKIREVMRYSGPRMMKYHPILALKHVVTTIKTKMKMKREAKK